jgi:transcription antitermination factor NusG
MSEKLKRGERVEIRKGVFSGRTAKVTQEERGGRVGVVPEGGQYGVSLAASSVRRVQK